MRPTPRGPVPDFSALRADLPELAWIACPGKGVNYPSTYRAHYGALPTDGLVGPVQSARTGHAADPALRRGGASGGVISATLVWLLERGHIDGAIVVRQGLPTPGEARAVLARDRAAILAAAGSVYVPVSTLDLLRDLDPGGRYALCALPDQAAALRVLQAQGHPAARAVRYVLGPYTGTALYPEALRALLRGRGVGEEDAIRRLAWRAGEWPGQLEIALESGRTVTCPKVYYNYLTPFYITLKSLLEMDFSGDFCDLSVGDAWSPRFEGQGGGHSVFMTRSPALEAIIAAMCAEGQLVAEEVDPRAAAEMHGHMIDFKKRGGWIRCEARRRLGRPAPDIGLRPEPVPASRYAVEAVISGIFLAGSTAPARWLMEQVPDAALGPLFNRLRLGWKAVSRPSKRRGLAELRLVETG